MTQPTHSKALRFFPSLTDVAFLAPVFVLIALLKGDGQMIEGDTGWHIRTGEWILANGRVPSHDLFSFSRPGEPWFAWEWLWDVGAALLHTQWGMKAVMLVSLFVICLSLGLLYRFCLRQSKMVLAAFLTTWLAISVSTIHWIARPHAFTFLFFIVFLWLLQSACEGRWNRLWALPLITLFWTNIHGGFLSGFVLIGGFLGGDLVSAALARTISDRRAFLLRAVKFGAALAASLVASLANPYGYRLHIHAYGILTTSGSFFRKMIQEWLGFDFNSFQAPFFELLCFLGVCATVWAVARRKYAYALLIPAWGHFALTSVRNAPLFAFVAAPILCEMLAEGWRAAEKLEMPSWLRSVYSALSEMNGELGAFEFVPRYYVTSLATFAFVVLLAFSPGAPANLRAAFSNKSYPVKAVETIRPQLLARRVFTMDEWGDYLIYRLYPTGRVFVDGRFDFYGKDFTEKYMQVMDGKYLWIRHLDSYAIDAALLPVDSGLASTLKESRHWRVRYDDGVAIFFERSDRVLPPTSSIALSHVGSVYSSVRQDANQNSRDRRITQPTHFER
jgi:hypothetical protein